MTKRKGRPQSELGKRISAFVKSDVNYIEVDRADAVNAVSILRNVHGLRGVFKSLPHRPGTSWVFKGGEEFYKGKERGL